MRGRLTNPSRRTLRIVLGGLFVLGLAWQQTQATRLGYEVETRRHELQALKSRVASLQVELQTGLSPARLAVTARTLGLQPAGPESLRILGPDRNARRSSGLFDRLFSRTRRASSSPRLG